MVNAYQAYLIEILNQILFWCEISKEHPIVITEFSELSDINMPTAVIVKIKSFSDRFDRLQKEALRLVKNVEIAYDDRKRNGYQHQILPVINDFLNLNALWIRTVDRLKDYGQENETFQTLLRHIGREQMYAQNTVGGKRHE